MTPSSAKIVDEIKNIKRKTALQQHCHFVLSDRFNERSTLLNGLLLLLSTLTMLSTTVHAELLLLDIIDEATLRKMSAFLSIALFLTMILRLFVRWSDAASAYGTSANAYTRFLRKLDMMLTSLDELSSDELERLGAQLTSEYLVIADQAQSISDDDLLSLKQEHLQKVAVSKELDKDPFMSISDIKRRLACRTENPE